VCPEDEIATKGGGINVSVKVCPEDEIATKGGGINAMNHAL